ncbi:hypothetical protein [Kurthia huakuii]|uniref:hypothetical protein n=1 Tax=Kurthia huakuii TaxID=1421019 RepID=UPI000494F428|nr:hypothetical protein [Kurthia huakuii]
MLLYELMMWVPLLDFSMQLMLLMALTLALSMAVIFFSTNLTPTTNLVVLTTMIASLYVPQIAIRTWFVRRFRRVAQHDDEDMIAIQFL